MQLHIHRYLSTDGVVFSSHTKVARFVVATSFKCWLREKYTYAWKNGVICDGCVDYCLQHFTV